MNSLRIHIDYTIKTDHYFSSICWHQLNCSVTHKMITKLFFAFILVILFNVISADSDKKQLNNETEFQVLGRQLVEQGRYQF